MVIYKIILRLLGVWPLYSSESKGNLIQERQTLTICITVSHQHRQVATLCMIHQRFTSISINCQGIIMRMLNITISHGKYIYTALLSNMWNKEIFTSCQHSKHILIFSSRGVKNRDIMPLVKTPLIASLSESAGISPGPVLRRYIMQTGKNHK